MDWASDGALYGAYESQAHRRHHAESQYGAVLATADMAKEVGILVGASALTAGGLSALAAYNHTKNPKTGMPQLGPIGLDTGLGIAGVLAAIFAGEYIGDMGQTIALGIGLGGINSTAMNYGAAMGVQAATSKGNSTAGSAPKQIVGDRTSGLSPEAQRVYDDYMGR